MTNANTIVQRERLEMMESMRQEVSQIFAEQKVAKALKSSVLPSAKFKIRPVDLVTGYSEYERKRGKGLLVVDVQESKYWLILANSWKT